MKTVINGKRYDTDKATAVASYESDADCIASQHVKETLYRKRTGEYFLHGHGGDASEYREYRGLNSWREGERIVPMTITEAEAWSERRLSEDERRSVFGGDDEDAEPVVIVVKLDGKHNAKLRRAAQERGISVTSMVRDMIDML